MPAYYHIRPMILAIFDGWGIAPPGPGNAITAANTPHFKKIMLNYPHCQLLASGEAVGLPEGEMGNSEVGHLNIGAGKVVYQKVVKINNSIKDGTFATNNVLQAGLAEAIKRKSRVHIMGLVGQALVHSSVEHLYALLQVAKNAGLDQVYLHLFTDGRDSPPNSGIAQIEQIEKKIKEIGIGQIASICGRYYSMDRDKRWDRIEKAYKVLTFGSTSTATSAAQAVLDSYKKGVTDEFIEPISITDGQKIVVEDSDVLIFFNYREDRMRELSGSFGISNFSFFARKPLKNLYLVAFSEYDKGITPNVMYPTENIANPLCKVISENGIRQFHIAETEKYAHVTYFINGGREEPFPMEDRLMIPSLKVATYDLKPEMSAGEITNTLITKLNSGMYEFFVVNFANPDMVGHSGKLKETIQAVETVDECLGKILLNLESLGGGMVVTADHGNAEQVVDPQTGGMDTAHSTNPVPFIAYHKSLAGLKNNFLPQGRLADVAPTVLQMLGLEKPGGMSGRSLIGSY